MAPRVLSWGIHRLASMMRPKATYGVPCTSFWKRPRWPPSQNPGTTSKTTGGRTSRMSCAA
eukprot:8513228-Alexandrium_andersonii.AAC.1